MSGIFFGNMINGNECNLTNSFTKLFSGQKIVLIFSLLLRPRRPEGPEPKEQLCNLSKFSNSANAIWPSER